VSNIIHRRIISLRVVRTRVLSHDTADFINADNTDAALYITNSNARTL
jgi:hypothetical protein